jgi:hypothetical protein
MGQEKTAGVEGDQAATQPEFAQANKMKGSPS